jgi:hypothetical protein
MKNQRGLRMTYPSGDVCATNLVMHWPVTETWPATKQLPETLKSTNFEALLLYNFLPFPCSGALVCISTQGQASQATRGASQHLLDRYSGTDDRHAVKWNNTEQHFDICKVT